MDITDRILLQKITRHYFELLKIFVEMFFAHRKRTLPTETSIVCAKTASIRIGLQKPTAYFCTFRPFDKMLYFYKKTKDISKALQKTYSFLYNNKVPSLCLFIVLSLSCLYSWVFCSLSSFLTLGISSLK